MIWLLSHSTNPSRKHFSLLLLGILFCTLSLCGCVNYKNQTREVTSAYTSGQFEKTQQMLSRKAAQKSHGKDGTKGRDALLWRLEEAASLRPLNRLEDSNRSLELADLMIRNFEENTADLRLGQETLSAFSNPANITYEGWTTDRIMVSTYLALNNLILGNDDSARIHFNKAYQRQRDAVQKNAKRIEQEIAQISQGGAKEQPSATPALRDSNVMGRVNNLYSDLNKLQPLAPYVNPFTSYLRGLFFMFYAADDGDLALAQKALEQASGMAPNSAAIREDLALCEQFLQGESPEADITYVIFETGQTPSLEQVRIDLPLPIDRGIYSLNVAFPLFQPSYSSSNSLQVTAENLSLQTQQLADMNSIFAADFKAQLPQIIARTIACVVLRQSASIAANQALKSSGNDLAMVLGGLAIFAAQASVNIADTRSWTLLPQQFQLARFQTPSSRTLRLRETRGNQIATVVLPSSKGPTLVFVKSVSPGLKMTIWSRKLGR